MTTHITGAPIELNYNGKNIMIYPLRDGDYAAFEIWAQDRFIQTVKRNIKDLPEAQQTILLSDALTKASLITFGSEECRILMSSIDGAAKLLHLSIRRGDPTITYDDVRSMCTDPEFVACAFEKIVFLSSPDLSREKEKLKKKKTKKEVLEKQIPNPTDEKKSISPLQKNTDGHPTKLPTSRRISRVFFWPVAIFLAAIRRRKP
ncbi:MAG TPA: hypothetical protein PLP49_10915 [Anaerohalosphaeraceae bacterium]|nr:hypothetical protein [Anaerohalosphaeraceae bacterium]HRT24510.1 hypothetical protein [Anaerohalosphaeraceae bacterium]